MKTETTTHTPGPWHVGMQPGPIIYGPLGEQIADLMGSLLHKDEALANMRLIAAAPDLLRALKRFAEAMEQKSYPEFQGIACDAFAAIEKAEGGK